MSRLSAVSITLASLVGVLLAADAVAWWLVTSRMIQEVAAWQQGQTAQGRVVTIGPSQRSGWPIEAGLALHNVTLATDTPGAPDAVAWQAETIRLVYAPWRPTLLRVVVDGPQTLQLGAALPTGLMSNQLDVHLPLNASGQADGIVVAARGLSIPLPGGGVKIDRLSVRLRQVDAFVSATGATLPGRSLPFGGTVQSLDLHARITGPLSPLHDPLAALTAWRDAGQRLLIDGLALAWGPLDVRGHAALGLDAMMQPEGTASVQLTGFAEVIEALARSGAITRSDARVATTLLGLMSRPGADDVAEADLPLALRDRTLSVGAIPLLRIPILAVP